MALAINGGSYAGEESAYCRKPIEQGKEVKNELLFIHGSQLKREQRDYCSVRCASFDQMTHEA
ncbi:TPA: YdaE family protein [Enterobacter hormaechei subsp. xiangfangensis]